MLAIHSSSHTVKVAQDQRYTMLWDFQSGVLDKVLPVMEMILDRGGVKYEHLSDKAFN